MGEPQLKLPRSFDEFLAWDTQQPGRYEFVGGEVRAMVGGTKSHYRTVRACPPKNLTVLTIGPNALDVSKVR